MTRKLKRDATLVLPSATHVSQGYCVIAETANPTGTLRSGGLSPKGMLRESRLGLRCPLPELIIEHLCEEVKTGTEASRRPFRRKQGFLRVTDKVRRLIC